MRDSRIEMIETQVAWQGYFRMLKFRFRHESFRGGMSGEVIREVFDRGIAAAVLPYDPIRDEVVLIEQFRIGAYGGTDDPWLLEPVAGIIEEGETAEAVARREAEEEAGLAVQDLVEVIEYFVSPGGATERCKVYVGRIDSSDAGGIFGLDDEGEDIRVHVVAADEAIALLRAGPPLAAHTVISLQWLALHRQDLRKRWQG